ncbi:MAG: hypothetical protein M3024_11945 [Candidatus Dormibacteraeota bacterium]|nr:hypothetical protein [Candidatus Dormibacteraeota bacterium]
MSGNEVHLVVGPGSYAGRHVAQALAGHARVRTAELDENLAAAMAGVAAVHMTVDLRPPLLRHSRPWQPPPGLVRLMDALQGAGNPRLVMLSSAHVHGVGSSRVVSEDSRVRGHILVERLRAKDEAWLRARPGVEAMVLRPVQGLGAGEPVWEGLARRLHADTLAMPGGGAAERTFLAGPDLGRAFLAAAQRGRSGRAYLLGGFDSSWAELIEALAQRVAPAAQVASPLPDLAWLLAAGAALRAPPGREVWPSPYTVELFARKLLVDDAQARRELSWSPRAASLAEALTVAGRIL